MQNFKQKVAVITGGASGIGLGLARTAVARGMKVVIADIEQAALDTAADALRAAGGDVLAQRCDVAKLTDVQALADATQKRFGAVHLLCNNAGVGGGGCLWEMDADYWNWVLGVNLNGVFHGIKAFTPLIIAAGEGHIVNTASIAGLMSAPGTGPYTVSKHAVVAMSEMLCGELQQAGHKIGVSVLCPSFVNTRIVSSERNRPSSGDRAKDAARSADQEALEELARSFFDTAMSPDAVAEQVFNAISENRFYVLTHPEGSHVQIEKRMRTILEDRNPDVSGPDAFPLS